MITLEETAYDDPVAVALVEALNDDINERYAYSMVDMTEEEVAADQEGWRQEVTPADVKPPHGAFIVARLDGEPAGCGAVKQYKPYDGSPAPKGVGEIKRMYTVPAFRRRGVSRAVLRALELRAAELGFQRLVLETGTAQPEALALYESHGWHRIEPYGRYKDDPASVCYAKSLTP